MVVDYSWWIIYRWQTYLMVIDKLRLLQLRPEVRLRHLGSTAPLLYYNWLPIYHLLRLDQRWIYFMDNHILLAFVVTRRNGDFRN